MSFMNIQTRNICIYVTVLIHGFNHDWFYVCLFPWRCSEWCIVVDWLPSLSWSSIHHCPSLSPCCLFCLLKEWIGNSPALVSKCIRVYCSLPWVWAHLFPKSLLHASHSSSTLHPRHSKHQHWKQQKGQL